MNSHAAVQRADKGIREQLARMGVPMHALMGYILDRLGGASVSGAVCI